jgi:hypothetical protein
MVAGYRNDIFPPPMKPPLFAYIPVSLQDMLPAEEFSQLMAYAEREGLTPDEVMLRALRAFVPQTANPQELAKAS